MADRSRADRAKLFAPFAALKGYYEMILEEEGRPEPRPELSEDDAAALNERLMQLEKGMAVCIRYYDGTRCTFIRGRVQRIDLALRTVTVGERRLHICDIVGAELLTDV